jgi:hypothetical protein
MGMQVRTCRVEAIRDQLWRLELGMTMKEVRRSLDVEPTHEREDRGLGPRQAVIVWSFGIRPKIEAVQPYLMFNRDTERLIEIVVDESRQRRAGRETPLR